MITPKYQGHRGEDEVGLNALYSDGLNLSEFSILSQLFCNPYKAIYHRLNKLLDNKVEFVTLVDDEIDLVFGE